MHFREKRKLTNDSRLTLYRFICFFLFHFCLSLIEYLKIFFVLHSILCILGVPSSKHSHNECLVFLIFLADIQYCYRLVLFSLPTALKIKVCLSEDLTQQIFHNEKFSCGENFVQRNFRR